MPQKLTFALDPIGDQTVNDQLCQVVEAGLRQQLAGLLIGPMVIGTCFDVALSGGSSARLRLTDASESARFTPSTRIVIVSPYEVRDESNTIAATAGFEHPTAQSLFERPLDLPGDLGDYVGMATVWTSGHGRAEPVTAESFGRLVGIPKDEVLADVVARLQPADILESWSREHYGHVIEAAIDALNSTPCILLAGDPGTGKSALAHRLAPMAAAELQEDVAFVQLNQRLRGYGIQGRAGSDVVNLLAGLTRLSAGLRLPMIAFLDEAEVVGGLRSAYDKDSGAVENTAVVDALIVGLDRIRAQTNARLVFVMATNLIERVDPAVLRRTTVYQFNRPTASERAILLAHSLTSAVDTGTLEALNIAMERSEGSALTAADILHQVVARAVREAAISKRPLDRIRLLELARTAVATSSAHRSTAGLAV